MKAYKGFRPDLTCDLAGKPFQYAEGEAYSTDIAVPCRSGFHACPAPLDTWRYYPPATSVYHEVEVADDAVAHGDKVASTSIQIGAKISIADLIEAHVEVAWARVNGSPAATFSESVTSSNESTAAASGDGSTAAASGCRSTAAASGYWSTAAASGDRSTVAASGYRSTAAASGYRSTAVTSSNESTAVTSGNESTAVTSGNESTAVVEGPESVAVAAGYECRARGVEGCWLVLVERDCDLRIVGVKAVSVGSEINGVVIEPGVYYRLVEGRVVAA